MLNELILLGIGLGIGIWKRWRGLAVVLILAAIYVGVISLGGFFQYSGAEKEIALPSLILRQYQWIGTLISGTLIGWGFARIYISLIKHRRRA